MERWVLIVKGSEIAQTEGLSLFFKRILILFEMSSGIGLQVKAPVPADTLGLIIFQDALSLEYATSIVFIVPVHEKLTL